MKYLQNMSQSAGFEPARAEPNGFQVHRLNHSATAADDNGCDIYFGHGSRFTLSAVIKLTMCNIIELGIG